MFLHLFKMIWNRKRSNSLIIAEIAIAFIVIFAVVVLAIRNYNLYQIPLGYNYENMWRIQIIPTRGWDESKDETTLLQIINSVKQQPEVETLHLLEKPTFRNWRGSSSVDIDGQKIFYFRNTFDDNAAETFGMTLSEGRWFGPQDSNQNYSPVLVNQEFVKLYFPNESVIGKNIADQDIENVRERRIVGVFQSFRQFGELSAVVPYVFSRSDMQAPGKTLGIELKLSADLDPTFEQRVLEMLKALAPENNYSLTSWESQRDRQIRQTTIPLTIFAIIAGFLIIMVAMGLFGVLWQNVTSRTHEIGLRRAMGATAASIHKQIIGELMIVTFIGMAIAFIGLVQLPMLGVFQELDWPLFWVSLLSAMAFMLTLAALCGYYPGKIATRHSPSEALHYD
jgi:putative ABC transport system permease protein